jgi:protein-tyrosine phosphatase
MKHNEISKITNSFFISGAINNYDELVEKKIDVVINCCAEQHDNIYELTRRGIAYYWIPVVDATAPASDQFEMFENIAIMSGSKILVHCALGVGRSVCFAVAYLRRFGFDLQRAYDAIKKVRDFIDINDVQEEKLLKYYGDGKCTKIKR